MTGAGCDVASRQLPLTSVRKRERFFVKLMINTIALHVNRPLLPSSPILAGTGPTPKRTRTVPDTLPRCLRPAARMASEKTECSPSIRRPMFTFGSKAAKAHSTDDRKCLQTRGDTLTRKNLKAVGAGFEPAVTTRATPVFKTGAFNRSATPPGRVQPPDFTTFILVEPQLTDRV